MSRLTLAWRRIHTSSRNIKHIVHASRNGSRLHPERPHKRALNTFFELLYVSLRWGDAPALYFAQGLDDPRKHLSSYYPYARFQLRRDCLNTLSGQPRRYNYSIFLYDKSLFEQFFSSLGIRTARTLQILTIDSATPPSELPQALWNSAPDFLRIRPFFAKPRFGVKGKGTALIHPDTAPNAPPSRRPSLRGKPCDYLAQEPLPQHPDIAQLHPTSLNTLRIITFLNDKLTVFMAYLRIGYGGGVSDNASDTRIAVLIDIETGQAADRGVMIDAQGAKQITAHPETNVAFHAIRIPFWSDCLQLIKTAHRALPQLRTVGWDIALTPEGPALVEGNDDWGSEIAMHLDPQFPEHFEDFFRQTTRPVPAHTS